MIQTKRKVNMQSGAAMLLSVVSFLFISLAVISGLVSPALSQYRDANINLKAKQSYFLAESGVEDVSYRKIKNMIVGDNEVLTLNSSTATTTVSTVLGNQVISSLGDIASHQRKVNITLSLGTGASFNYGVQVGQGGFILENSATVTGNIYSSGSVTGAGNTVSGDVVSAGASGLVDNIHSTGSMYAHTIQNSNVGGNAYYVTKTNTTVTGSSYPNSTDQPIVPMPISDEQIEDLNNDALSGGTISSPCTYVITTTVTLGPKKINCDLEISGNAIVTLTGNLWVSGNISIKNSAIIKISAGLGSQSVAIIADNINNRTSSSKIDLANTSQFQGSGASGSFVFLISMNNSAEGGGSEEAIGMDNSSSGSVILYAPHGLIAINNSANLKEVTGYKIKAKNSANVTYESGLANTLFTSGPGGGYEIIGWGEGQ